MIKDFIVFSIKSLTKRRLRSWLTLIGIFIGIAVIVALIGLGEGLTYAVNSQFGFLGTNILGITASGGFGPPGTGVVEPLTDKELDKIKQIDGIEGVAGRLIESAKISFNKKVRFTYAVSAPDGESRKVMEEAVNMKAQKGRLLKDGDKNVVVVGANFLDTSLFGKQILPGSKVKIQDKEFSVIGVMDKKGNFQIDQAVIFNEQDIRELFNREQGEYDVIAAKFKKDSDVERIKLDIEKELGKIRNVKEGEENFNVQTPASILETVNSVLLGVKIFVYLIAGISILVGGIGIMNTMYTSVVERTKDIGIMKSIGAKNSTIFLLFFMESGLLGLVGGVIGVIIGFLAAQGLSFIGRIALNSDLIAAHITYQLIVGAILFSFVLGSFSGTLPAAQASKLNPVDSLRHTK